MVSSLENELDTVKRRIREQERRGYESAGFDLIILKRAKSDSENLRLGDETWKVQRIEPVFKEKMFEEAD